MGHVWEKSERRWENGLVETAKTVPVLHCSRCGVEGAVVGPLNDIRIVPVIGHRTYEDAECEAVPGLSAAHSVIES